MTSFKPACSITSSVGRPDVRDLPDPERLAANAQASLLGVVDKIDFDQLTFNTDDE